MKLSKCSCPVYCQSVEEEMADSTVGHVSAATPWHNNNAKDGAFLTFNVGLCNTSSSN